jgi:NodT family efflux transporter outer membrane factor (OMF) lipoprotein
MKTNQALHSFPILGAVFAALALLVSGCLVGPDFQPPHPEAPASWEGVTKMPTKQPLVITAQPAELTQWWRQFDDPMLTGLVEEAIKANLDLQLAKARLRQARALRGVAVGGLWPAVTATATYQREKSQGETTQGGSSKGLATTAQVENLYQAGFDAVWEIDVFGGLRRNVEAASANVEAAVENISDTLVTLVSEVGLNYIQLRGWQQEIVIAKNNLKAQQDTATITRQRSGVGFLSALDVANAEAAVATTEATIPVFETSAQQAIYALSVLLARPPADLLKQLAPTRNLPSVPAKIPAGLPSNLLRRRPDIREAEAQLHAATAQIGVATAQLFPQFSLTGTVNWQSNLLLTWWGAAGNSYSFGPSVTWPIFQGGAIISNVRVQEALRDQAFITYQKTVLSAFQDVENAMIAFNKEQQHRKSLKESVIANRKAVELSVELYTMGLLDFLNVLIAQRSLYTSEDALMVSNTNIVTDLLALYKALGGGWEFVPSDAQTTSSTPTISYYADKTK